MLDPGKAASSIVVRSVAGNPTFGNFMPGAK
jgi:hypothetical protein